MFSNTGMKWFIVAHICFRGGVLRLAASPKSATTFINTKLVRNDQFPNPSVL